MKMRPPKFGGRQASLNKKYCTHSLVYFWVYFALFWRSLREQCVNDLVWWRCSLTFGEILGRSCLYRNVKHCALVLIGCFDVFSYFRYLGRFLVCTVGLSLDIQGVFKVFVKWSCASHHISTWKYLKKYWTNVFLGRHSTGSENWVCLVLKLVTMF